MKRKCLISFLLLLTLLCACSSEASGSSSSPVPTESVQPTAKSDMQSEPTEGNGTEEPDDPMPEETPVPESEDSMDAKSIAASLIGEDISVLYDAIGYPQSSDYAPSCLGDGDDGNLYYDGFIVYTYREGGSETVYYVE